MQLYGTSYPVYPAYNNDAFWARYDAEQQVRDNTPISGIKNYQGPRSYGSVDLGAEPLTSASLIDGMKWVAHTTLDLAGMAPGVGEIADGLNSGLYAYEGDYWNAGISAAATIPFAGWAATVGFHFRINIIIIAKTILIPGVIAFQTVRIWSIELLVNLISL